MKGRDDKTTLVPYIEEIEFRALAEVTPSAAPDGINWDKLATVGSKVVFLWFLTGPKSALIQATQLHMVGLPVLTAEYGAAATLKTAARYTAGVLTGQKLSTFKKDANGDIVSKFSQPSIKNSRYIADMKETDPDRYEALVYAWNYANDRDAFMSTFAGDLNSRGDTPSAEYGVLNALRRGRFVSAGMQGTKAAFDMMGGAFHHMERMNREIMFMSAFELAYDKALKQPRMTPGRAQQKAAEKAMVLTYESLFNFTQYNKPRLFKHPMGRITTQFLSFSAQMTSYLVRNFYGMLPLLNAEGKKAAATRVFGTVLMSGMYAGLTGLPLYSAFVALLEGMREALRDEDEEMLAYIDDESNPLGKVSLDFWFRNQFIPDTFGTGSSLAEAFGLTDEQAEMLARAAELGFVSALTDLSVTSSTSLDSLWHTEDSRASTTEGKFKEFVFNTVFGPLGSLGSDAARAMDLYEKGEGNRAVELIMPAFVRGAVKAGRLSEEGLLAADGAVVRPSEFYDMGKLLAQGLGFASTEASQAQMQNIMQSQIEKKIEGKKTLLINQYDVAVRKLMSSPSESNQERYDEVNEAIRKYNANFPTDPITLDTLGESQQRRAEERAASIEGSTLNPDLPVGLPLALQRSK